MAHLELWKLLKKRKFVKKQTCNLFFNIGVWSVRSGILVILYLLFNSHYLFLLNKELISWCLNHYNAPVTFSSGELYGQPTVSPCVSSHLVEATVASPAHTSWLLELGLWPTGLLLSDLFVLTVLWIWQGITSPDDAVIFNYDNWCGGESRHTTITLQLPASAIVF